MEIRSLKLNIQKKIFDGIEFYSDGRVLKNGKDCTVSDHCGYRKVYVDKKRRSAHRVLYSLFVGEIVEGLEIDHINGIRDDNRVENLEAVTHKENIRRAAERGSYKDNALRSGQNHGRSILDDMKVLTIRTMPKKAKNGKGSGFSNKELASLYGVSVNRICNIRSGKEWKMLPNAN